MINQIPPAMEWMLPLCCGFFIVALLYSCVGHAGASGYIAVMSLAGLSAGFIKPMALILNVGVALITSIQFWRAGHFSWALFWPFAILAVPAAFLGGWVHLPGQYYKILLGGVLCFAAWRLTINTLQEVFTQKPSRRTALGMGAGLGFLSGLTGTGGGIFLTPLLLLNRWASAKTAAGVSAVFILANSTAGLAGLSMTTHPLPRLTLPLAALLAAALAGGLLGSQLGSRHLPHQVIKRCLSIVLLVAGAKLIITGISGK